MSSEEGESRSERLRRRRTSRGERASAEPTETAETEEPDETSEPSKPSQSERKEPSKTSVKEEQIGTYMYLPESQKKEVERLYTVLKADYEYEFEDEFEKNRHFFPMLIQYRLDGLEASEVRDKLDSL